MKRLFLIIRQQLQRAKNLIQLLFVILIWLQVMKNFESFLFFISQSSCALRSSFLVAHMAVIMIRAMIREIALPKFQSPVCWK